MNPICPPIRERILEDPKNSAAQAHLQGCEACSAWWKRTERVMGAISGLARPVVPSELETRLAEDLAADLTEDLAAELAEETHRETVDHPDHHPERLFERELRRLARLPVPAILDDLVFESTEQDRSSTTASIVGLLRHTAPPVLDRLVAEEIEDPARHRAERFAGDLGRLAVPAALDVAVPVVLGGANRRKSSPRVMRTSRVVRRLLGPIVTMAAGVMLWTTLDGSFKNHASESTTANYRFSVVRATSVDQLSPLTQSFLQGMTRGGVSLSIEGQAIEGQKGSLR